MLTFYMTPGSCTTGIHILLEECEALFSVELVNLMAGDQNSESFRALNPKGSIPMLKLDNGEILTEFEAIACWLAWSHPRARLISEKPLAAARAIELMSYAVSNLHMQAFARIFTPERFLVGSSDLEAVKAAGRRRVVEAFGLLALQLPDKGYACGDFSIADAALFYVEFWADRTDIPLPAVVRSHFELMLQRPCVRQVLMEEGYRL
ncbi:glutathione S-transferase family protein [Marinobacterium mangrovicola]|uniref:Glutathione S-transferase n=1 Tax=Marinobacterium mangrovicola TaxID=1476959 RepID=A0A4R1GSM2_9GAMM|nr:glutathione S-transferase C-terminal domain-containing protein [Marinobacterium mangrovicola]TCK09219.1 glutathione S-transferase [Marinobacterium mangrovicola]